MPATLSMSLPPLGSGTGEDELADELGVLDDEGLGDEATEGEREDVDLVQTESLDERVGVVGHRLDAVGNGAGGAADTAVVEGDDVVVVRDGVDDAGVPVVQRRSQVHEEHDGNAALRAQLPVRVGRSTGGDGARGCVLVRRHHAARRFLLLICRAYGHGSSSGPVGRSCHVSFLKKPTVSASQLLHKTDLLFWDACSTARTTARTVRSRAPSR